MLEQMQSGQSKNRNFICSCQKAYLSYAALFTHIKQKHGGKAPGQIVRPRSLNKRGRPRKSEKPGNQRGVKSESYNGLSSGDNNNNKRAIISNNNQHSNYISSEIQSIYLPSSSAKDNGRGFKSYRNSAGSALRQQPNPITMTKRQSSMSQYQSCNDDQQSGNNNNSSFQQQQQFQDENMEFSNINNQFSNNTLTLASIIIGLQQTFKQATGLEIVRDERLEYFASYGDLKKYHALKLSLSPQDKKDEDVFVLGNVICAFLNFCHQTLDNKASYQQIVLLMVCLLDHIRSLKPYNNPAFNILTQCRKQVIHESLPSFFEQYLQKVLVRYRMKYWIFRENNSFKVLIWFLNWLSAIEVNYLKSSMVQQKKQEKREQQDMMVKEEGDGLVMDKIKGEKQFDNNIVQQQQQQLQVNKQQQVKNVVKQQEPCEQQQKQQQCSSQQQDQQQQQQQQQVQFQNPVFFPNQNNNQQQHSNLIISNIQKHTQQDKQQQPQQNINSSSSPRHNSHSSSSSSSSSESSSPQQQHANISQNPQQQQSSSQQQQQQQQQPQQQQSEQNNDNIISSNGLQRLSSQVR